MTPEDTAACQRCNHPYIRHQLAEPRSCVQMVPVYMSANSGPGYESMARCSCTGYREPGGTVSQDQTAAAAAAQAAGTTGQPAGLADVVADAWRQFNADMTALHERWTRDATAAHGKLMDRITAAVLNHDTPSGPGQSGASQ